MVLSFILFIISYCIVSKYGKQSEFDVNISEMDNIVIEYDNELIECKETYTENRIHIDVFPKKTGKATIIVKGDVLFQDEEIKKIQRSIDMYIHKSGIITVNSYLGKCNGDISFNISFYIILLLIFAYLIYNYVKSKKKCLYSYHNVRILGLIIFIAIHLLFSLTLFLYDIKYGFNQSLYELLMSLQEYIDLVLIAVLPVAILLTLLVMISNIKLIKMEGKSWRNILGVILGGTICFASIFFNITRILSNNNNYANTIIYDFFYYEIFMFIVYHECILVGASVLGIKAAKHIPEYNKDAIMILGCQIRKDGTLTNLLKGRADRAIEFAKMQKLKTNKDILFVPSGGKGDDEIISEAEAIKRYLIKNGIEAEKILIEDKSTSTYENFKFSNKKIKEKNKNAKIAFSTTNYHVFRAGIIANKQGIEAEGIGSDTKMYYWLNAFVREFVATLVSEKKSHIKTLVVMSIILFIFSLIRYLAVVL